MTVTKGSRSYKDQFVYFQAMNESNSLGYELYQYDCIHDEMSLVVDMYGVEGLGVTPTFIVTYQDELYFSASIAAGSRQVIQLHLI